jgi:hypothetical protein
MSMPSAALLRTTTAVGSWSSSTQALRSANVLREEIVD